MGVTLFGGRRGKGWSQAGTGLTLEVQSSFTLHQFFVRLGYAMANIRREERGGGSVTQKMLYQKWPDQISPVGNFGVSHCGDFGHGGRGGGGSSYGCPPF